MHPYPHRYTAEAAGAASGSVSLSSQGLADIDSAPPAEFNGPGDRWSPETLLCAAVADCLVLTFRAIARASRFEWQQIRCSTEGVLDRADGVSRFIRFSSRVCLTVPGGTDEARARQLVEKSERGCLVANSLNAERTLSIEFRTLA
ncbi:MAG TPA: OsmC family protein [Burkholderiaceae bacterium]|nr:OsmC family protein [Burkholderiaceae bacterium]